MSDVRARAHGRLQAIRVEIEALVAERDGIDTFLRLYDQFSGDAATEKAADAPPAGERVAPSPATNTESAAPTLSPAKPTEAQAKHAAEDALSSASEGVQDRCESTPSPNSQPEPVNRAGDSTENVGGSAGRSHSTQRLPTESPASVSVDTNSAATPPATDDEGNNPALTAEVAPPAASANLSPATPSLAARLRALNVEHPEFTVNQVAEALGETRERVQNNSAVHKIRWAGAAGRRDGMGDLVVATHRAHSDWPATRIAEELSCEPAYVRATAARREIILPSERDAHQRPASAPARAAAPEPLTAPERPPAISRPPIAASPSGGSAVITKPMVRPKGTRFYLRNDAGLYLHYSCTLMTSDKAYAWSGTHDQLLACRKKFDLARDLAEHVVAKEQRAA